MLRAEPYALSAVCRQLRGRVVYSPSHAVLFRKLRWGGDLFTRSEGLFEEPDPPDHRAELFEGHGEGMVGSGTGPIERDVLLDQ